MKRVKLQGLNKKNIELHKMVSSSVLARTGRLRIRGRSSSLGLMPTDNCVFPDEKYGVLKQRLTSQNESCGLCLSASGDLSEFVGRAQRRRCEHFAISTAPPLTEEGMYL